MRRLRFVTLSPGEWMEWVPMVSSTDQIFPLSRPHDTATPRLSIVVPLDKSATALEETLISVLENRPEASEVLVCHDGRYHDPFDLGDEVRFVTVESSDLVDLVSAGAVAADGRFIHVIASGLKATAGWTDAALEKFEIFNCGSVAAVVRHESSRRIVAAGWQDTSRRLCQPMSQGQSVPTPATRSTGARSTGAFLSASFWRTDLLRSLGQAFHETGSDEATVAYEYLARKAGWRCEVAQECDLTCQKTSVVIDRPSISRGAKLRRLRNHFHRGGWSVTIQSAVMAMLTNVVRPSLLSESMGQALATVGSGSLNARIKPTEVVRCEDREPVLAFPPASESSSFLRRAA